MSIEPPTETRDERRRRLARERQRRKRARAATGDVLLKIPAVLADEIAADDDDCAGKALEILRRHVARKVRDIA